MTGIERAGATVASHHYDTDNTGRRPTQQLTPALVIVVRTDGQQWAPCFVTRPSWGSGPPAHLFGASVASVAGKMPAPPGRVGDHGGARSVAHSRNDDQGAHATLVSKIAATADVVKGVFWALLGLVWARLPDCDDARGLDRVGRDSGSDSGDGVDGGVRGGRRQRPQRRWVRRRGRPHCRCRRCRCCRRPRRRGSVVPSSETQIPTPPSKYQDNKTVPVVRCTNTNTALKIPR